RVGRPMLAEPAPFGLRHRFAAKRILARKSRPLQPSFDTGERFSIGCLLVSLGDLVRKSDDEAKTVLKIVKLCFTHKPTPIETVIPPCDPRQRLAEPRVEIVHPQRIEQESRWIDPAAAVEVRKSRVTEGCQPFDKALCVVQAALHRHWK